MQDGELLKAPDGLADLGEGRRRKGLIGVQLKKGNSFSRMPGGRWRGEPGDVQSSVSSWWSRVTISVGVGTLRASSVMKSWSPPM